MKKVKSQITPNNNDGESLAEKEIPHHATETEEVSMEDFEPFLIEEDADILIQIPKQKNDIGED